jgi:hypothetical protein
MSILECYNVFLHTYVHLVVMHIEQDGWPG